MSSRPQIFQIPCYFGFLLNRVSSGPLSHWAADWHLVEVWEVLTGLVIGKASFTLAFTNIHTNNFNSHHLHRATHESYGFLKETALFFFFFLLFPVKKGCSPQKSDTAVWSWSMWLHKPFSGFNRLNEKYNFQGNGACTASLNSRGNGTCSVSSKPD